MCGEVLLVACPECGAAAEPTQQQCHACSCVLRRECTGCGASLQPGWVACPECGATAKGHAARAQALTGAVARQRAEAAFARSREDVALTHVIESSDPEPLDVDQFPAATAITPRPARRVAPGRRFSDALPDGGAGPEMIEIPAGDFRMGDIDGFGMPDEMPVREVSIRQPFALGRYPVTFAEYDFFCERTGRIPPEDGGWGRGPRPVIIVSWECARDYVEWLSGETGESYRLPSEAEWEYAARAGTETAYPWGDTMEKSCANFLGEGAPSRTTPVGLYPPNGFGLHDMHGNVWEWVEDVWHDNYEGAPTDGSPWVTTGDPQLRVLRGGSWYAFANRTRSAARNWFRATGRNVSMGFRLARDV